MYLRAHFACLAAGLFLLSSCGESGNAGVSNTALTATGTVENSPSADPWTSELSDRIRDAAHAFAAEGEAFTAESAEHGITGRLASSHRRPHGTIRTHCRVATKGMTLSTQFAAFSTMRRPAQDGQNPRILHENRTSL